MRALAESKRLQSRKSARAGTRPQGGRKAERHVRFRTSTACIAAMLALSALVAQAAEYEDIVLAGKSGWQ